MKHHESKEQQNVITWANLHRNKYPALKMLFAVPNGGARSPIEAAIMKGEGVKPGVPDLLLLAPSGSFHGLAIEMKREKGGTVSDAQKEWLANLKAAGYCVAVCHGAAKAIATLTQYLHLTNHHDNTPQP